MAVFPRLRRHQGQSPDTDVKPWDQAPARVVQTSGFTPGAAALLVRWFLAIAAVPGTAGWGVGGATGVTFRGLGGDRRRLET